MLTRIVFKSSPNDLFNRLSELAFYVRQYKIDLFCSHTVTKILPTVLMFKFLNVPIVLELHGIFTGYVASTHEFLQPIERNWKIFRLADGLVVLSRVFERFWKNLGCNAYYIPNPLPPEGFGFRRDPSVNRKTILWVGRIVEAKGVREIIPIMREVIRKVPNAKLRVLGAVGDPYLFEELKSEIKSARLKKCIEFCGYQLDVRQFYATADVMLTTSPAEGFSFTIAESKLFALPMVCYELPYLELLRSGGGYISVRQGDASTAASAIAEILSNDELRLQMSTAARKSIEPFIGHDFAGDWKRVFDDAINGRRAIDMNFEANQIELLLMNEIWKLLR